MILSPRAGGVGLTLTRANHVIHLSRWWNPAVEDQWINSPVKVPQVKAWNRFSILLNRHPPELRVVVGQDRPVEPVANRAPRWALEFTGMVVRTLMVHASLF
jgi:hypothetical protein